MNSSTGELCNGQTSFDAAGPRPRSVPHGGAGPIGTSGRVGTLRLDVSTADDVAAFAGSPDADEFDSFQVPDYPDFEALGYSCTTRRGGNRAPVPYYHGPYCRTVFYINQATGNLAAVYTSSRGYLGPGRIHPGMSAPQAEGRTHKQATAGCDYGFTIGTAHTPAMLLVTVNGGHIVNHNLSNGSTQSVIIGGTLGGFSLESNRHPVGLLFC